MTAYESDVSSALRVFFFDMTWTSYGVGIHPLSRSASL
jgi:hypothetical protein